MSRHGALYYENFEQKNHKIYNFTYGRRTYVRTHRIAYIIYSLPNSHIALKREEKTLFIFFFLLVFVARKLGIPRYKKIKYEYFYIALFFINAQFIKYVCFSLYVLDLVTNIIFFWKEKRNIYIRKKKLLNF